MIKAWFNRIFRKKEPVSDNVLKHAALDAHPVGKWRHEVSMREIEEFGANNGKGAVSNVLSKLGRYQPYYNIMTSEIGQMLLADSLEQCNDFLTKIVNDKADATDRAEYRAYRRIIDRQLDKIYSYLKTVEKVKGRKK